MTLHNEMSNTCPACGEGLLEERQERHTIEHGGVSGDVPLYLVVCSECGSELATAKEAKANKRAVVAFRKQAEGLLTGTEMREARRAMGLSQSMAATLFGGGQVAFSRYENDDVTQSEAMDGLVRLCLENPGNLGDLAQRKGVTLPSALVGVDASTDAPLLRKVCGIKKSLEEQLGRYGHNANGRKTGARPLSLADIQAWRRQVA